MQVHNGIVACTAIASTRPNRKNKAILKACESERWKCMWMVVTYGELRVT